MHRTPPLMAILFLALTTQAATEAAGSTTPSIQLTPHLIAIAALAQLSPTIAIPAGEFSLGSKRIDDDLV